MPELNIIVAVSNSNAIGKDNKLLWHLPADLKFFKETTMGCPIIMGRKTYESIGRALPGRRNIVITRNANYEIGGVEIADSVSQAISLVNNEPKVFIIGGADIYSQTLSSCTSVYITRVDLDIDHADVFFPELNNLEWKMIWEEKHTADEKNKFNYTYQKYIRI